MDKRILLLVILFFGVVTAQNKSVAGIDSLKVVLKGERNIEKKCGLLAIVNKEKKIYTCKSCSHNTHFSEIHIPYAMKLFIQEVQSMNVASRLMTT